MTQISSERLRRCLPLRELEPLSPLATTLAVERSLFSFFIRNLFLYI